MLVVTESPELEVGTLRTPFEIRVRAPHSDKFARTMNSFAGYLDGEIWIVGGKYEEGVKVAVERFFEGHQVHHYHQEILLMEMANFDVSSERLESMENILRMFYNEKEFQEVLNDSI